MPRSGAAAHKQSDREVVELFLERAEELAQTHLAKSGGLRVNYGMHYEKDKGTTFELQEPDENDLRSYLLTFRHFIAEGESIFIGHMYNMLAKRLTDEQFKAYVADARVHWSNAQKYSGTKLVVNDKERSAREVTDWFINGHYFHSEPDKRAKVKTMEQFPLDRMLFRYHFLSFVVEATNHIMYLRNLIMAAMKEGKINLDELGPSSAK